jgi:hypothetical protein
MSVGWGEATARRVAAVRSWGVLASTPRALASTEMRLVLPLRPRLPNLDDELTVEGRGVPLEGFELDVLAVLLQSAEIGSCHAGSLRHFGQTEALQLSLAA